MLVTDKPKKKRTRKVVKEEEVTTQGADGYLSMNVSVLSRTDRDPCSYDVGAQGD